MARWKDGRVDAQTTVIGLTLGLTALLAAAYVVVLLARVLLGGSTDPSHVISGAWDVIRVIVTASIVWSGLKWLWRRPRRRPPS